jgi:response regulator of citrate/malate metabolism
MKTKQALTALDLALQITAIEQPKREDEFTASEFADRADIHAESARRLLNSAVKDGKLTVRKTSKGHYYSIAG